MNADDRAIDQVIVNFVTNAIKYAPLSLEIKIQIQKWENGAKLSVCDSGPGISPEQLPFVFDRYFQGAIKDFKNPGLGLGERAEGYQHTRPNPHRGIRRLRADGGEEPRRI